MDVEKNQSLQNLKYNLGTTEIAYQGDGLFDKEFGQQVNQIGIVQNFPSQSITKAQNKLQDAYTNQSSIEKQLTENELKWKVKQIYFDIQYKKELGKLYRNLVSLYEEYYGKATVRVQLGAANPIEKFTLKSKWQEYKLLLNQVEMEIINLNSQFQLLLNTDELVTPSDSLFALKYSTQVDMATNPIILRSQQDIAIETAKVDILKSELKPSFNIGYASQRFYEGGWLNAMEAGISFNLFNGQTRKRINAQKIQIDIGNYQYQSKLLRFKQDQLETLNTLAMYEVGVVFYKDQIESINPEIERISQLNYQAGEISYLELLSTLQLMATNNKNYWEQIVSYNKAVADYQFLTNQ